MALFTHSPYSYPGVPALVKTDCARQTEVKPIIPGSMLHPRPPRLTPVAAPIPCPCHAHHNHNSPMMMASVTRVSSPHHQPSLYTARSPQSSPVMASSPTHSMRSNSMSSDSLFNETTSEASFSGASFSEDEQPQPQYLNVRTLPSLEKCHLESNPKRRVYPASPVTPQQQMTPTVRSLARPIIPTPTAPQPPANSTYWNPACVTAALLLYAAYAPQEEQPAKPSTPVTPAAATEAAKPESPVTEVAKTEAATTEAKTQEALPNGQHPPKPIGNPPCDHVDSHKRLRCKRGYGHYLCLTCGEKWKTPNYPVQGAASTEESNENAQESDE